MSWFFGLLLTLLGCAALFLTCLLLLLLVGALLRKLAANKEKAGRAMGLSDAGLLSYHDDTKFERVAARKKHIVRAPGDAPFTQADAVKLITELKDKKPLAVLSFDGNIKASGYRRFANLVDEIEINKDRLGGVIVRVTSPGGTVPEYGHLCAEMERIRGAGLDLTVCVDTVAASGGYLMSIPATRIVAAPFAYVGSIGVVASVPNVRKLMEKVGVTPRTFTAGKYKRTLTTTDEETPDSEGTKHFQESLDSIHKLFSDKLAEYRPNAKLDEVTSGAHWTAQESVAKGLGLVDEIGTSNGYLLKANQDHDLIYFGHSRPALQGLMQSLAGVVFDEAESRLPRIISKLEETPAERV
jgi:signal peptide peptidase SppA